MKPKTKANHYVDNKVLYVEMIEFKNKYNEAKEKGLEPPRMSDYIGKCIFMIANRLASRPNFYSYSFKDDMISDGIENCIMYLHNFDPDKSKNPFAYITQIIYYAFLRRIQKEQKQQYIKHKLAINSSVMNTLVTGADDSQFDSSGMLDNDRMNDLVEKFEKSNNISPKKSKKKGIEKFIGTDSDGEL